MTKQWAKMVAAVVVAGFCAGCGAEADGDDLVVGDEEFTSGEALGSTSQALVGCAATVVSSESHTGWLYSAPTSLFIDRIEYRIKNPSSTACATMSLTFQLKDDIYDTVIRQTSLTTSLSAGANRRVYWDHDYESSRWWVNATLLRNGNSLSLTYIPTFFRDTGQY